MDNNFEDDSEYKIVKAINQILKADSDLINIYTNLDVSDFNIYSSSLMFRNVITVNNNEIERALAVYFPNKTEFINHSNNWVEIVPTIYIESMAKIPHDEFGDEPARRDSYSQLKKIKKVLEKNKTLKVLFSDLETNIQEAFQVASFRVKSIEPLDFSSFNKNFYSCITLMELEIITA